jgi:hypothetical protein
MSVPFTFFCDFSLTLQVVSCIHNNFYSLICYFTYFWWYISVKQDETGVYKNLLQEVAQRVGAPLPSYTRERSGLGHLPVFACIVELAGITFTGDHAKNKKQADKNTASAAWASLKQCEYY